MKKQFLKYGFTTLAAVILLAVTLVGLPAPKALAATLTTPNWIASHMVLQRDMTDPIWGTGTAGATVTVSFNGQNVSSTIGADGKWRVDLASMAATTSPLTMTITSSDSQTLTFTDVQVGEVWGCSGQSNMELDVSSSDGGAAAITDSPNYNIRLFSARGNTLPTDNVHWTLSDTTTTGGFSAVCYYFGKELAQDLNVPIGLISSGKPGTPIEQWTHAGGGSGSLYVSKIKPFQPYAIRGFNWYQGEDDARQTTEWYYTRLSGLISEWRTDWGIGNFPFGIVQLPMGRKQATRDAQMQAFQTVPNTFIAITSDLPTLGGQAGHPANKRPIGQRLAIGARSLVYGGTFDLVGPIFDPASSYVTGNTAVVAFTHLSGGLVTGSEWQPTGAPYPVYLAGSNGTFYAATSVSIVGNTLQASSTSVAMPVSIRYTYEYDMGNLYSIVSIPMQGGASTYTRLPAAPFGFTFNSGPTPTPVNSPTPTNTPTKTATPTITNTPTVGPSPTFTNTPTITNTPGSGGTSIFFDGFEDGSMSDWSPNNNASIKTSPVYAGAYSAGAKLAGVFFRTISTAGYANIHVKYAGRTSNLDAGEYLRVEWYDGSTWTVLDQLLNESGWTVRDWSMPAGAANNASFALRFSTNANGNTEWVYVDSIEVTSQ